jgi:hypothetical protein
VAQPGIGWSVGLASPVNYPPFHTIGNTAQSSWRWHWAGQARDLSSYDFILANLGTNESGEWIFVMVPVSGRRRNVFNTLTLPDSRVKVIDLDPSGNDLNLGLDWAYNSWKAPDTGQHPLQHAHAEIAARLARAIQAQIGGVGGVRRLALTGGING